MQPLDQGARPQAERERIGLQFQPGGFVVVRGDCLYVTRQAQRIDRLDVVGPRKEHLEQIGRPQRKEIRLVPIDKRRDRVARICAAADPSRIT
jgi:hypothetical protein